MTRQLTIDDAIEDANLFRPFLHDANGSIESWDHWRVALRALYGLSIRSKSARALIRECTGRTKLPKDGFQTALFLTGRRSGKSRIAAVIGAYEATLAGNELKLSKGERGVVAVVSPTKNQSRVVKDYMRGVFSVPLLAREIERETREGFELKSGTRIECLAGDWRTVRNFTCLAVVVDEAAFLGYSDESKVRSDTELIRALKPSLATCGGRLIAISSPYAMKGWCYAAYKKNFGNEGSRTLVWNCASRTMNPTLPQSVVDEAMEEDRAAARAEYMGEFRDDVATFLPRDVIESVVVKGRAELPPITGHDYAAFVDLSGGRVDDAALAIAHRERERVVLDLVRQWKPPFSPDRVVGEMVTILNRYRIERAVGDNYSAEFVKAAFESRGIEYERATTSPWSDTLNRVAKNKSQLYLELLPRLCSGEIELLDNETLISQLANLERRTRSGGRDIIDHGPNRHDDVANVVAGVCCVCVEPELLDPLGGWFDDAGPPRHRELSESNEEFLRLMSDNCPGYGNRLNPNFYNVQYNNPFDF
jgi:hypothetical protein